MKPLVFDDHDENEEIEKEASESHDESNGNLDIAYGWMDVERGWEIGRQATREHRYVAVIGAKRSTSRCHCSRTHAERITVISSVQASYTVAENSNS